MIARLACCHPSKYGIAAAAVALAISWPAAPSLANEFVAMPSTEASQYWMALANDGRLYEANDYHPTAWQLLSVVPDFGFKALTGNEQGWIAAATSSGHFWTSSDGGTTWQRCADLPAAGIVDVNIHRFVDHSWIALTDAGVVYNALGGTCPTGWTELLSSPPDTGLVDVSAHLPSGRLGAMTSDGELWLEQGSTWQLCNLAQLPGNVVAFNSNEQGWLWFAVAQDGGCYRTLPGSPECKSFSLRGSIADVGIVDLAWNHVTNRAVLTSAGHVWVSEDDGATWTRCADLPILPSVIHVPQDFPTIQAGVDAAATGDTVLVAPGTYTGDGNKDISPHGVDVVLISESGPQLTIIDCENGARAMEFQNGETSATRVEGFTFRNGFELYAGAILISGSSPTIVDCVFLDNTTTDYPGGGAILIDQDAGPMSISGCVFEGNAASMSVNDGYGAGVDVFPHSSVTIQDCQFTNNSAANGGGVHCNGGTLSLIDCIFEGNTANAGGAVQSWEGTLMFAGCFFFDNYAVTEGGAIRIHPSDSLAVVADCVLAENSAGVRGGAYYQLGGDSLVTFSNCTFFGSSTSGLGSAIYLDDYTGPSNLLLLQTIIASGGQGEPIVFENSPSLVLECCDIWGNAGGNWTPNIFEHYGINGNIELDPLFCDAPGRDLTLRVNSPCAPLHPPNSECDLIGALPVGCDSLCVTTVTYPNGGEVLCAGNEVTITWDYAASCGSLASIELLRNDQVCLTIAASTPNDGEYSWLAEQCGVEQLGYTVRITDLDSGIGDDSDAAFTIEPPCSLAVTFPNGGESFRVGDDVAITWDSSACCGDSVQIELLDGDVVCMTIAALTENDGQFTWPAARCGAGTNDFKIRVTNQAGDVHDDSDAGFSITELRIVSVLDIGNDQGRQVRVRWQRALHDRAATDTTITSYSLWRRVDQYKQSAAVGGSDGGDAQSLYPPGEWDYVLTVPAHGEDLYSTVSPTLCDSTIANGMCWSVFFVRAETPDPLVFFDAPPDSGYSIDNLAPAAPGNFRFLSVGVLAWDESEAADFNYFTVYGSYVDHLEETAEVLGQTTETTMDISGHWFPFYHLTATDFSGNEGEEATAGSTTSAASSGQVPQVFALHQSAPNPGSSGCRISFDLPVQSDVSLKIFDAAGRQVVTLEDRVFEPGSHSISWDGLDASGVAVPSGVYFYRLEAGTFVDSRKILITW